MEASLMDPDENLRQQRRVSASILAGEVDQDKAEELAALVYSMDQWLSSGGFPPKAWNVTIHEGLPTYHQTGPVAIEGGDDIDPFSGPAIP
jgi:hypothetical protein